MSDNSQELFCSVPNGFLDVKYHENGNVELYRVNNSDSEELIAQGEEVLAIVNYDVYEELNSYSIRYPHISASDLILKAKEFILWEQIHGDD